MDDYFAGPAHQQQHHPGTNNSDVNVTQQESDAATTMDGGEKKRPFDAIMMDGGEAAAEAAAGSNNDANFVRKPVGKDGEPLSEKKLRRLEKNRLSARECRRRKREATENMERQINLLEGENLRLRLQLQIGDEAQETMHQEQQKLTEGLDDLLKSGASESEIYAKIEVYKEKFADYGRDRRSAIEFHLRNVERLLMPTQTTSFVLATLQGGTVAATTTTDAAALTHVTATAKGTATTNNPTTGESAAAADTETTSTEKTAAVVTAENAGSVAVEGITAPAPTVASSSAPPTDNKALFKHLVKILEVTPEQAAALKDSRFVAQEMDEILKETLSVLTELRSRLTQCGEDLETEFNNVRTILTPSQSAKFLVWVSQNKACMHMLNELWSKVYPSTQKNVETGDDIALALSGESSP